jgi:hypothetical protein
MATFSCTRTEDALKTINNPDGGQIIYGPIGSQPSVKAAMGKALRQIHDRYGDRPQVGRLFQDRNGQVLGAFFNVTSQNSGGRHIAGLVMVSVPQEGQPSMAVITDDAQRFPATVNSMLQRLSTEWNSNLRPSKASVDRPAPAGVAAPLHEVAFPDNSGSVGLPDGWQLTGGHKGAMQARGPNGENLILGLYIPVMDPTNRQASSLIKMETRNGRVPLPGLSVAIPYGTDPVRVLKMTVAQLAQKQKQPTPTINVTKVTDGPAQGRVTDKIIESDVDNHDGQGVMALQVRLLIQPPFSRFGSWAMTVYQVRVPKPLLEQERATIAAITKSYKVNSQVVIKENQHEIALSNQLTKRTLNRIRSNEARMDQWLATQRANGDAEDKSFKKERNTFWERSVIGDNRNRHATVSNADAAALVKEYPDLHYVPTKDYVKGIDY